MPEHLLSSSILQALALTLIHFIWQGALVAFVLKIALSLINNQRSQWRYGLSCAAMLTNLLIPFITFFVIFKPENSNLLDNFGIIPMSTFQSSLNTNQSTLWYSGYAEYLPYLAIVWLASVFILSSKLLIELHLVNKLPKKHIVPTPNYLESRFSELVDTIGLKKAPQLLISLKVEVPMAIGWLKPVVLLPASMISGLSKEQLEMLILHELAHIKRYDYLVNFLQTLVEILLFFHPAVVWVSKQMRQEREYCSDDIAVQHCGNAIAYAHTLTDTAALCRKHRHATIPSMAMAASGGDLKQRVVRLVGHHCASSNNEASRWFAGFIVTLTIVTAFVMPYVKLPMLDFSAGNLKFFPSAKPIRTNVSEYLQKNIAQTSIAQQLLTQNPLLKAALENEESKTQKTQYNSVMVNEETIVKSEKAKVVTAESTTQIEKSIKPDDNNPVIKSTEKVAYSTEPKVTENKEKIAQQATAEEENIAKHIEGVALAKVEAIEPVFNRNDNYINTSSSQNPYAKEVELLALEVNTQKHLSQTVENDSSVIDSYKSQQLADFLETNVYLDPYVNSTVNSSTTAANETIDAQLITSIEPRYPTVAKRKRLESDIKITFTIDVNGRVKNVQFEEQSRISYFRSAILSAMQKWRFLPAQQNGKPVESQMAKIFAFSLAD